MNPKIVLGLFIVAIGAVVLGIAEFVSLEQYQALPPIHHIPLVATTTPRVVAPQPIIPTPTPSPVVVSPPPTFNLGKCASITPTSTANILNSEFASGGFNQDLYTQTSTVEGWNFAIHPNSYCLLYPSDWTIGAVGVFGQNLKFNESIATGTRQVLFVEVADGHGLALDQLDKASYSNEGSGPDPLVNPAETILQKKIETIGDKQLLFETSKIGNSVITRYFFASVMMFQSSISEDLASSTAYADFLSNVVKIISSTRFFQ